MFNDVNVPELLVPAGDFDCVRAGVQNGADCIYFGANMFSARANAKNFSLEQLKDVIDYCKIRNVKTNLTLNTLLTDAEFGDAIQLAKSAYDYGIDAIIVQDLGLGKYLIDNFPNLEIHASTQMSVHNLEGVLELEKLGFSRVVLSREVPINEIEYIRNNCKVELEMFVHGALCISYSGQCLFSSLVGGRSGNRGKCAQPCRLPYELLENDSVIDKGFLLSSRDLCSLEFLPDLVKLGVNSFKIEGRMKAPEYVATVTRIYRKYVDLAVNFANGLCSDYLIDKQDIIDLQQVFNRGGFSSGHLLQEPNKDLIFKDKPDNMGLFLGNVSNYNSNKGHVSLKLNNSISIGDSIGIEGETGRYTVSELMKGNANLKNATTGETVKIGRMKGKIRPGAKVFKLASKTLNDSCRLSFCEGAEIKKIPISCFLTVKKDLPISLSISANVPPFYNNVYVEVISDIVPEVAVNQPIDGSRLSNQLSKLGNTPYSIDTIHIDLDDNLHIPSISGLNDLRRKAIAKLEEAVLSNFASSRCNNIPSYSRKFPEADNCSLSNRKVSVLLGDINLDFDYSKIKNVDNVYIPLKFFANKKYSCVIETLSNIANVYIYMPTIVKQNYKNLLLNNLSSFLIDYKITGFVVSNVADFVFLSDYIGKYEIVANYTMNVFNCNTIEELKNIGVKVITPSIELDKTTLQGLCKHSSLPVELICYGRSILMNSSYCLLGKSNKCYPECKSKCSSSAKYFLKDRLGFKFRVIPDNLQTVTSIYNSKVTSIDTTDFNVHSLRISILDEDIEQINSIVDLCRLGKKCEGPDFTNGNLNKNV